jgi:hypothetical protein
MTNHEREPELPFMIDKDDILEVSVDQAVAVVDDDHPSVSLFPSIRIDFSRQL